MLVKTFVVVLFSQLASAITIEDCPDSQTRDKFLQVFEDKCYYFNIGQRIHFQDAQGICQSEGGNLAMVKSKEINRFLIRGLTTTYTENRPDKLVWIGLSDLQNEGAYTWVDGSPLNYTNFAYDQGPRALLLYLDRSEEDCVAMNAVSGEWYDYRCESVLFLYDEHRPYICEFEPKYRSTFPTKGSTPPTAASTTST